MVIPSRESLTLQLSCANLRLKIDEAALGFDMKDLIKTLHDQVCGSTIAVRDRNLDSGMPNPGGLRGDPLDQSDLAGIAQTNARSRVQPNAELISDRCGDPRADLERWRPDAPFNSADELLAHACERCDMFLGHADSDASEPICAAQPLASYSGALHADVARLGAHRADDAERFHAKQVAPDALPATYRPVTTSGAATDGCRSKRAAGSTSRTAAAPVAGLRV